MALIYKNFAVLSVGLSCQVAHQLDSQKNFVDGLIGEKSVQSRTPFDWIVAPPNSVVSQLREDKYFPDTPAELTHVAKNRIYYWERMKSWFFHADEAFDEFQFHADKFSHLSDVLHSLVDKKIIAIWTNNQKNMQPDVTTPPLDNLCRRGDLLALEAELRRFNPTTELIPVVCRSRIDAADPPLEHEFIPYNNEEAPKNWKGDSQIWRDIFTLIFKPDTIVAQQ